MAASAGDTDADGFADVLVGADRYEEGSWTGDAALLFRGGPAGPSAAPDQAIAVDRVSSNGSLAGGCDLNGDGYDDLFAGDPYWDDGVSDAQGRLQGFAGGPSGLDPAATWEVVGSDGDSLGETIVCAGDLDDDGYDDVAATSSAGVEVFRGGAAGPVLAWTLSSDQTDDEFGEDMAGAVDVDGDGVSDLVVGIAT